MGSEDSKPKNENSHIYFDSLINNSFVSSDYNDISSSESGKSISQNINIKNITKKENINEKTNQNNNKLPVTFEWDNGGDIVYLSGNFCNWNQLFLMKKNSDGKYILKLDINKDFIQYKFKVDNVWKINEKLPSIYDHGNLNNYIDCTKCDISKDKSEQTTDDNTESSFSTNNNNNIKYSNKYGNFFPKNKDKMDVKIAPDSYRKKIKNKINKNLRKIEIEKVNHIIYNITQNNSDKNRTIVSIVSRYRLKFTNFVYYKNTDK